MQTTDNSDSFESNSNSSFRTVSIVPWPGTTQISDDPVLRSNLVHLVLRRARYRLSNRGVFTRSKWDALQPWFPRRERDPRSLGSSTITFLPWQYTLCSGFRRSWYGTRYREPALDRDGNRRDFGSIVRTDGIVQMQSDFVRFAARISNYVEYQTIRVVFWIRETECWLQADWLIRFVRDFDCSVRFDLIKLTRSSFVDFS